MKKVAMLFALLFFAVSFAQAQTDNDAMYDTLPKAKPSVVEQGSITEAGKHIIAAGDHYTYARLAPVMLGLAGGLLIAKTDNPEIGYGIGGVGVLIGIFLGFKGDNELRKAGRKLQLYSGNQGLGMSLKLQ
jgi:hypothetical protein